MDKSKTKKNMKGDPKVQKGYKSAKWGIQMQIMMLKQRWRSTRIILPPFYNHTYQTVIFCRRPNQEQAWTLVWYRDEKPAQKIYIAASWRAPTVGEFSTEKLISMILQDWTPLLQWIPLQPPQKSSTTCPLSTTLRPPSLPFSLVSIPPSSTSGLFTHVPNLPNHPERGRDYR